MTRRPAVDVSRLAPGAFGYRSIMFWGTLGIIFIEGMGFALTIGAYFYLRTRNPQWPPDGIAPPSLLWGTVNTLVLLVSGIPNQLAKKAAERVDIRAVRLWLVVCLVFGLVFNAVRVMEYLTLNVLWNTDAYGSIVWLLMALHTTHLVTDTWDTTVLDVLFFAGPLEGKRYVDVSENAVYWYFVIFSWLPIYAVVYLAPRG